MYLSILFSKTVNVNTVSQFDEKKYTKQSSFV